ncbi:MAG: cytochrome P450 [Gammaproteobacteria bacterium]
MSQRYSFDPSDPELRADPYPRFRWLREHEPVHWSELGFWVVTGYEDAREVLRGEAFGQGDFVSNIRLFYPPGFDVLANSAYRWLSEVFVMRDPPDHTRLRKLVVQALDARRITAMRPRIAAITEKLLDELEPLGGMDVIHDFAYRLPTRVMCDMLGIDESEVTEETLSRLNQAVADSFIVFETRALSPAELTHANAQIDYLTDYFDAIFEQRRREPREDLTTALVNARDGGSRLSREELATVVIGLFGAGFETTAHMIGNGLLTLHRHPGEWQALCAEPALARQAVEEILRYESSLQASYRTALRDTTIRGTPIRRGQRVLAVLSAGNRDPAVVPHAETFDIRRAAHKPLSFGGGIHFCVGAELARAEGEIAFTALARRFPRMQVDTSDPAGRGGFLFRGLERLHATW